MKKAMILLFALALTACSLSDEQKAEKLITKYLERNANDPSSVEIIEISPIRIDSVKTFEDEVEWQMLIREATDEYEVSSDFYEMGVKDYAEEHKKKAQAADAKREKLEKEFVPYSKGKFVIVEYRAKNAMGALVKSSASVRFDDELTKVEEFKDSND